MDRSDNADDGRHGQIDTRHDDAAGEVWLHGQFSYVLYRHQREGQKIVHYFKKVS